MKRLVGLDIGTSHLKACLYDLDGHELAVARADTPTIWEGGGRAVYDPENLWEIISGLIRIIVKHTDNCEIIGIATTGMSEAGLLLDSRGEALHHIITWFDNRSEPQAQWWMEHGDPQRIFEISGLGIDKIYSLVKIMWVKENWPDLYAKADKWLCITDYIAYRLSGKMTMDYSTASRTMAFDIRAKNWSDELLEMADIPVALWPKLVASGTVIGKITADASMVTGLKTGIPVVAGGQDHVCATLAAGVIDHGDMLDSWGTAEVIMVSLDTPLLETRLRLSGFQIGVHVIPGKYYIMGGIPFSGGVVEWLRKAMPGLESYDLIFQAAAKSPAGAKGLIFLPHLIGAECPIPDPQSRSALIGLRNYHNHCDIVRAILEGVCFELKGALSEAEAVMGRFNEQISILGGGLQSTLWRQIKADINGKRIIVPDIKESAAQGAAILAGLAVGIYPTVQAALKRTYRMSYLVNPSKTQHELYEKIYHNVYRKIYQIIKPINESLQQFTGIGEQ